MDADADPIMCALIRRAERGELEGFLRQGESVAWCAHPVRLEGRMDAIDRVTGERTVVVRSSERPDGVVMKPCGNRRESACRSCSSLYRSDARHLVRAGLMGEKGVGEEIATHPSVFLTLTASSFGRVHSVSEDRACRRSDPKRRCVHGRPTACFARHAYDDEIVGSPICSECFDYEGAVLQNASTPELWRRFTIYLPRALAAVLGITQKEAKACICLNSCRVAEFQRRGLVHLHCVIRADSSDDKGAPAKVAACELALACRIAASSVQVRHRFGIACFGSQLDVQVLDEERVQAPKLASYIAKYASKSASSSGALDRRIRNVDEIEVRDLSEHLRSMVRTAWRLGEEHDLSYFRLRHHAHTLGYGGQFLSKSRGYSTTFGHLRAERAAYRLKDLENRLGLDDVIYESSWKAVGVGWSSLGETLYAESWAEQLEIGRRIAYEESRVRVDRRGP